MPRVTVSISPKDWKRWLKIIDPNKFGRLSLDNKIKRRIIRGKIAIKLSISFIERHKTYEPNQRKPNQ